MRRVKEKWPVCAHCKGTSKEPGKKQRCTDCRGTRFTPASGEMTMVTVPRIRGWKARKKQSVREWREMVKNAFRQRGRHDIAHASNDLRGWTYRAWSLDNKSKRRPAIGTSKRRLLREDRARNDYQRHQVEKTYAQYSVSVEAS